MNYLNTQLRWEDIFIQELVALEEKLPTMDVDSINKSKLRLCIENKILDWAKYEEWLTSNLGCASLKSDIDSSLLENFKSNSKQALEVYSNYDFWSEELLPVFIWENQLVIFGLQYNENISKIDNHIFILAHPDCLSVLAKFLFNNGQNTTDEELDLLESETVNKIDGLDLEIKPPTLDFKSLTVDTVTAAQAPIDPAVVNLPLKNHKLKDEENIWDFITERHEEYIYEAKKNFSAYVVLQIDYDKTKVFKMDPDLEAQNINSSLFQYDLNGDNPFARVFKTGVSEAFSISQLGMSIADYKYLCITALKRSERVVGFLVGFKNKNLSENDQILLEDLAKESA